MMEDVYLSLAQSCIYICRLLIYQLFIRLVQLLLNDPHASQIIDSPQPRLLEIKYFLKSPLFGDFGGGGNTLLYGSPKISQTSLHLIFI